MNDQEEKARTHNGYYDWGASRQGVEEKISRARVDLKMAKDTLDQTDTESQAYTVMLARYHRAQKRLAELEEL